ncbi:pyridoxal 5'-phosphate synthase glutaminase subunit PdxT [Corynebacterium falsenii]|uniref:pyridoxal 5'-phosphate synthase glutaminase subunit PdxT n=1 Tax=Corynebacterium falsenii TaxID=108486 RepID=UPI00234C41D5|nr:pyridoxal 5'-phosphate synthase glutaminase subunit PdxT [Corynebacterium falsenii]MDC7103474.1 pyridoxal 5'-phosphate synthase glutaminase subunit PdxT [Corynebacterium falsenii]
MADTQQSTQPLVIGVMAVQGGFAEHCATIERLGHEVRVVRRPQHLEGLDGLILPGGESTTMSKLLEIGGMLDPLREAISGGLPTFGTCAGLIMLATEVLDTRPDAKSLAVLDVAVRRNAFGRQVDSFETTLPFGDIDTPVDAVFIRAPRVERVGDGVEVVSQLPDDTIVAVRQGHVLGCSFHPELTEDDRVHEYFLRMIDNR